MENPEQRGFAAAARPDDRNEFTGKRLEAYAAQDFELVAPCSPGNVLHTSTTRNIVVSVPGIGCCSQRRFVSGKE